jgi:RHS repeat-associated protein
MKMLNQCKATNATRRLIWALLFMFSLFVVDGNNVAWAGSPIKVRVSNYNFGVSDNTDSGRYSVSLNGVKAESTSPTFYAYVCCQGGIAPWEIAPFVLTLQDGIGYDCVIKPPSNHGYCCGDHDTRYLFITSVGACSSVKFAVNGTEYNGSAYIPFDPYLSEVHATISVLSPKILFHWDYPKDGVQALTADGMSTISGTSTNSAQSLIWSFDGPDLGCKLLLTNGPVVMVQAGTNTGTVNIKAVDASDGTCTRQPLQLVDCASDGCSSCQGGGGLSIGNNCVEMKLNLGWSLEGGTAGYFQIKKEFPSASIAAPGSLRYNFQRSDVQIYSNSFGIYQVKAPAMLANIVTNSSHKYSIQLFNLTNIVGGAEGGGYQLTNSPYRIITVENPGGNTNKVLFTDSNDGATYDFTWQTNGWLLTSGNGLRNELKTTIATNGTSIVTTTVSTGSESPVQARSEIWQTFSTNSQRLIREVFGSGSAARTNTYSYNASGFRQQVVRWDGSWEYYLYDDYHRPTSIFSGFLNQGVTTNSAFCRLTVLDYSAARVSGSGDNGLFFFTTPRCTIEYVQGQEVSRKYFVGLPGQRRSIQCATPGAAWNDSGNLVTTYNLFTNEFRVNEPRQIIHPDGTADIYQYANVAGTAATNIVMRGHLDATGTSVDDGSKTITVTGPTGLLLSQTTLDIKSGITTARELYAYDSLNRLTVTVYLDGTYDQKNYDCCVIGSLQARDGAVTSYTHDGLKRLVATTVNNVTVSNAYDAAGNILTATRIGSDGSAIFLRGTAYDTAGRVLRETNALLGVTHHTATFDASGQTVKTTTYPDNGTRIETYYQDGSLQSVTGTAVAPLRYEYGVESEGGTQRIYTKAIALDSNGSDTGEWIKTYTDMLGRAYKTVYADNATSVQSLNSQGQLSAQRDPDGVTTLYQYGGQGELEFTALDVNANGMIDFAGNDRITQTVSDVVNDATLGNVWRTRTYAWSATSSATSNLVSSVLASTDGLRTWSIVWNGSASVTNQGTTVYDAANGRRIVTMTAPDGSSSVTTNEYDRTISVTRRNADNSQLSSVNYSYDAHGRRSTVTDARTGATTFTFNNADQVATATTPLSQTTTNYYESLGRVWKTTLPDGGVVTNDFYQTGRLKKTCGARTYPVEFTYDAAGRMKTMKTWQNFSGNAGVAVTTWNFDGARGWLTNKVYDGNTVGPSYTFTGSGKLKTRIWARTVGGQPLTTTYGYNPAGDLQSVSYSDGTPGITNGFDRLGRQIAVSNGDTVCAFAYDDASELLSESYSGGLLAGLSVTNGYDPLLRRTAVALASQPSTLVQFGFDAASRLKTVSSGNATVDYSYVANSPLVGQIVFTNGGTLRMTTTRQFDNLNRLTQISSAPGGQGVSPVSFNYNYNTANQRTAITNADNSRWAFQYDPLGQVTSGRRYWDDGTAVAGQQYDYTFDDIGNRKTATRDGRQSDYSANLLNQYTNRTVPGYMNILGSANSNATVTVWGTNYLYARATRHGDYFRAEVPLNNSNSPVWLSLTNLAVLNNGTNADIISTNIGNVYLAQTPESPTFDADGNLTSDGRWTNTWNAENRLVSQTSLSNSPVGSKYKVDYAYDYSGRMIQRVVSTNDGTQYVAFLTNRVVYDGKVQLAELNETNGLVKSHVRGLDLSGTMQGAAGVGGLLAINAGANGTHFYAMDGNENVMALVNATNGTISAQYDYSPFGEKLRASGTMAFVNTFGFSSQYEDPITRRVLYLFRPYNPSTGGWDSRDPIEEQGGLNLYAFVANDVINSIDIFGSKKLKLVFDSAEVGWDPNDPKGTFYVTSAQQIGEIAKREVGQYDPEGVCSNCISELIIAGHGGGGGEVPLGNTYYSATTFKDLELHQKNLAPKKYDEYVASAQYRASTQTGHQTLLQLSALKCKNITVIILACNAGEDSTGALLRQQLLGIFGPTANIVTFTGECGFSRSGKPVPAGWDPFSIGKKPKRPQGTLIHY